MPFISISKPPMMMLSIHIVPISSKKTRNTQRAMKKDIWMLESICKKIIEVSERFENFFSN